MYTVKTEKKKQFSWKQLYHKFEKAVIETHSSLQQEKQVVYLTISLLARPNNVFYTNHDQLLRKPTSQEISDSLSLIHKNFLPLNRTLEHDASPLEYLSNYYQLKLTLPCARSLNARKLLQACPDWQSLKQALEPCSINYLKIHVGYEPMSEVQYEY